MGRQHVRAALKDQLCTSAPLLALLPHGAGSIINEHDVNDTLDFPLITIHAGQGHPLNLVNKYEIWDIRCYDNSGDYILVNQILDAANRALNDQGLPLDHASGQTCTQVELVAESVSYNDPVLHLPNEFYRYRIYLT